MTYYRDTTFDRVLLLDEQKALLVQLVEASRRVPLERREKFILPNVVDFSHLKLVMHPGLEREFRAYEGDVEALAREGLLATGRGHGGHITFDITPRGYKYYELDQIEKGTPVTRVEASTRSHIDGESFRRRYPGAYAKWQSAERLLWGDDSANALTTIGHLCRESIQEFMTELLALRGVQTTHAKAQTVARLRVILAATPSIGASGQAHAEALVTYAGTLVDLIQRQEHGGTKERGHLMWEDGRRVVFHTLIVFAELDRFLGN